MTKRNRTRGGKKPFVQFGGISIALAADERLQRHVDKMSIKKARRKAFHERVYASPLSRVLLQPNLSERHPKRRAYNRRVDPMPFSQVYG